MPQGPHSHILMTGGGGDPSDFFGSESDLFGSMKDARIFWVAKKKGFFGGCKKGLREFFRYAK